MLRDLSWPTHAFPLWILLCGGLAMVYHCIMGSAPAGWWRLHPPAHIPDVPAPEPAPLPD